MASLWSIEPLDKTTMLTTAQPLESTSDDVDDRKGQSSSLLAQWLQDPLYSSIFDLYQHRRLHNESRWQQRPSIDDQWSQRRTWSLGSRWVSHPLLFCHVQNEAALCDHSFQQYGCIMSIKPDASDKKVLTDSLWEDSMPLYIPNSFLDRRQS